MGQLRGDVLQVDIADGLANSTVRGNASLCMQVRTPTPNVPRYGVWDFASRCVGSFLILI